METNTWGPSVGNAFSTNSITRRMSVTPSALTLFIKFDSTEVIIFAYNCVKDYNIGKLSEVIKFANNYVKDYNIGKLPMVIKFVYNRI